MRKILAFITWRRWGILRYNSFWQNCAGLFYLALAGQRYTGGFIVQCLILIVLTTLMTAYGYLVNDFADVELDRLHGKPNAFQGVKRSQARGVIIFLLVAQGLVGLAFWLVLLAQVLAATFYSLPPLRLKERGAAGLLATVTAQQSLPTALLFAAFGQLGTWGALAFVLFATLRGLSSDVGHQLRDWANDAKTNTGTFAVRQGYHPVQRLYALSLEGERIALGIILLLMLLDLPAIQLPVLGWQINLAWPLVLGYVVLLAFTVGRSWMALHQQRLEAADPYDE